MSEYLQTAALVLLCVILVLVIGKKSAEIAVVLSIFVCCLLGIQAMRYWQTVMDFAQRLQVMGQLDQDMVRVLWRVVGIAVVSEICCMICADSGNAALGKALQFFSAAVIMYVSIPMFSAMLELLQDILRNI